MMMMISAGDLIGLYLGLELHEPLGLRDRLVPPRPCALDRSRAEIFRARRALVRACCSTAPRWCTASPARSPSPAIATALQGASGTGIVLGLVFVSAGVAFKISAVPFHMWTPDVYEGAPTPVTAFFASAPKVAAMAMAVRVFVGGVPDHPGAVAADHRLRRDRLDAARLVRGDRPAQHQAPDGLLVDRQRRLRARRPRGRDAGRRPGRHRLHGDLSRDDARQLRRASSPCGAADGDVETIDDLSGLARTQPALAFAFATMLFSLAGIPFLAGFFAKFYVFAAAVGPGW